MPIALNARHAVAVLAFSMMVTSISAPAEGGPLIDWLFGRNRGTAQCATCGPGYAAPAYPVQPGIAPTTVQYPPNYQTTWQRVPTTTFRPTVTYDPVTGTQSTTLQPCAQYTWQARRVPVTAYRPLLSWLLGRPTYSMTAQGLVAPGGAYAAAPVAGAPVTTNYAPTAGYPPSGYALRGTTSYYGAIQTPGSAAPITSYSPGMSGTTLPGSSGSYYGTTDCPPGSSGYYESGPAGSYPSGGYPSGAYPGDGGDGSRILTPADEPPALPPGFVPPGGGVNYQPTTPPRETQDFADDAQQRGLRPVPDPDASFQEEHTPPARPNLFNPRDRAASGPARGDFVLISWPQEITPASNQGRTEWTDDGWRAAR